MFNPGRIGVLRNPEFPAVAVQSSETEAAAKALGVQLQTWEARNQQEITAAFSSIKNSGIGGLIVFSEPVVLERHRGAIIGHAVKFRIPNYFSLEKLRRGGWPHELFGQPPGYASTCGNLRR
jgi:ABC-type uncharacterized transport system substrate-binding protein